MTTPDQSLITKTALKERGWTEALIRSFFPVPTEEKQNPHYRSGPTVKLYDTTQVISIESSAEFQNAKSEASKRSISATARAKRMRDATISWAEELPKPDIPIYSKEKLRELACKHYNCLWSSRGEFEKHADVTDSDVFLDRISVNYLRHELTPYEERMLQAGGRVGVDEAQSIIRKKILSAIAEAYPWLSNESHRQRW